MTLRYNLHYLSSKVQICQQKFLSILLSIYFTNNCDLVLLSGCIALLGYLYMEDIGITIAAKISEYLVDPLLQHVWYMFSFNKFVRKLQHQKGILISTQRSVNERIKEVKRKTEIIAEIVERWVNDVMNVLEKVEKLEAKVRENKSCHYGIFQYFLAKEVARVIEKIRMLSNYTF